METGTHCIADLYGCPRELLDNVEFVKQALREAASAGLAELLDEVSHRFTPHGVTVLGLLAESHISIHTFPEHNYAAVDAYTCGKRADPQAACLSLAKAFRSARHSLFRLERGAETTDRRPA
jgi:S-adenosylmethionine decarboxylase